MKYIYKILKKIDRFRDVFTDLDQENAIRYKYLVAFQSEDGSYMKWNSIFVVERHPKLALIRLKKLKETVKPSNRLRIK